MRYIATLIILFNFQLIFAQGNGFTFNYSGPTQIIVGPDCEEPLLWGHPNTPTVHSNIPGGMIVSFEIVSISGGFQMGDQVPGGSTVTIFYQALDNFGNIAQFGFSINFIDILPPVFDPFSLPPPSLTINCINNLPAPANVEATDNCDNDNAVLTITLTETNNAQLCTGGIVTRRWVADDDLGNQATFIQTITVTPDNTPPVITNNLVNGSSPCSTAVAQYTTWLNTQRMNFTATDSGCGLMTKTDNAPAPNTISGMCGDIVVKFTATDNCSNSSSVERTFSIVNNVPPVITIPASGGSGNCGQNNIASIFNTWINTHGGATAIDDCSNIIWSTIPPNPSIYDTCDAVIEVMFIASDGCNNSDTTMAPFVLIDDTGPNILVPASTSLINCTTTNLDSVITDWLTTAGHSIARDLCTRDAELSIQYGIAGSTYSLEEVLSIWQDSLNSGCRDNVIINGIGINNVKAMLDVDFLWTDNCNNTTGTKGIFGITDNGRPVFASQPQDTSFACASGAQWQDVFQQWYATAGFATIMDGCSEINVTSNITADSAMTYLAAALDTACDEGVSVTLQFTLTDDCGNVSMTQPTATFQLSDTLDPVFIFRVADLSLSCTGNAQEELNEWLDTLGGATAMDGCGVLSWKFQWSDSTGVFEGLPEQGPYPDIGASGCGTSLQILFIATDGCQNSIADTAAVSLLDTLAPEFTFAADSVFLECFEQIPESPPGITDNCDPDPDISFEDVSSTDSCVGAPVEVMRIWIATDACQNESRDTIWYFRSDDIPPTFTLSTKGTQSCNLDSLYLENVMDNCDPDPLVTFEDILTGEACGQTLTRIWTVADACGNVSTAEQIVNLEDNTPPAIEQSPGHFIYSCHPSTPDVQASYDEWKQHISISDDCSSAGWFIAEPGSYSPLDTMTWPGNSLPDMLVIECGTVIVIPGHLVVYDDCGNVHVDSISFTIRDTVPPVFELCPDVLTFDADSSCSGLVHLEAPTFTEICNEEEVILSFSLDLGDTIIISSGFTLDSVLSSGLHVVEWFAKDCAGLTGICQTQIKIFSEDAVTLNCTSGESYFTAADSCSVIVPIIAPQIETDSCSLGIDTLYGNIIGDGVFIEIAFETFTDTIHIDIQTGNYTVNLIVADLSGDIDTCSYQLLILDTISPVIICDVDTISVSASGLDTIFLNQEIMGLDITEACLLDTIEFSPAFLTCADAGNEVVITTSVKDINGNEATCMTNVFVQVEPYIPTFVRGLCEDTLRLFSNITDTSDQVYTFEWVGPGNFSSNDGNPVIPDADSLYNGVFQVTVTSENGCVSTGSVEVIITDLNTPVLTASKDTACTGQPVLIQSNVYSGEVIYNWYHLLPEGDTLLISTAEPFIQVAFDESGNYTLYASASQDTCDSGAGEPITITIINTPVAAIGDIPLYYCVDDTVFLSPVVEVGIFNYQWIGPGGYVSDNAQPEGIPVSTLGDTSVFYLTVSNQYCVSPFDSITIFKQAAPPAPSIAGNPVVCEGGEFTLITSGEPGDVFQWIGPEGTVFQETEPSLTVPNANDSHEGFWRVFIIRNGCSGDTSSGYEIMVDTSLSVEITSPDAYCEGDSIDLIVNPVIIGDYTWSGPGGFSSLQTSPSTLAVEGLYRVTISTNAGCDALAELSITVDHTPELESILAPPTCVDGNTPLLLTAISFPGFDPAYTYHWSGPSPFNQVDSTIVFEQMNSSVNGDYTLFIANGICNSDTLTISLSLIDGPSAPVISGEVLYCSNDTIRLSIAEPLDTAIYTWITPSDTIEIPSPGDIAITDLVSGTYSVFVTNAVCTSDTTSVQIEVMNVLVPPVILNSSNGCEGDSIKLIANTPSGASIHWIGPNGFSSTLENPVIFPLSSLNEGEYFVTYTIGECTSPPSEPFILEVLSTIPSPLIIQSGDALCIQQESPITFCIHPNSTIQEATYTWYLDNNILIGGPDTDSCFLLSGNGLTPGFHTISAVTSLRGCISEISSTVQFQADNIPDHQADAGDDLTICPGEIIFMNADQPLTGTGMWSSSSSEIVIDDISSPNTSIGDLTTGEYVLTWTLSSGACIAYDSDEVLIHVLTTPITLADTFSVPFGQTQEFIVVLNDTLNNQSFTLTTIRTTQRGNALHAGNGIFRYTPNVGFVGTDTLIYQICSTECPGECDEAVVLLRVGDEDDCFIPTLFTPNSDGINDRLIVPCLETLRYPNNRIIVFNEWGNKVFEAAPYLNNWEGTYQGEDLPVGTYFYIMDFGDGATPKRSFLVLER